MYSSEIAGEPRSLRYHPESMKSPNALRQDNQVYRDWAGADAAPSLVSRCKKAQRGRYHHRKCTDSLL
jgi:hypothetical protein